MAHTAQLVLQTSWKRQPRITKDLFQTATNPRLGSCQILTKHRRIYRRYLSDRRSCSPVRESCRMKWIPIFHLGDSHPPKIVWLRIIEYLQAFIFLYWIRLHQSRLDGACHCLYLIKWCQVKLFGDELLEVEDRGLCRTADPFALQTSKLAAVALQADADLQEENAKRHDSINSDFKKKDNTLCSR